MNRCTTCLTPDTRPFMEGWKDGVCPACQWNEEKKTLDWNKRREDLKELCNEFRGTKPYDVLVPCSGGKDGSYVAHVLKHEFGMNPLAATFSTPMWTQIGRENLWRFTERTGIPHILITPNQDVYRAINKRGFVEDGYPKRGFVAGLAPSMVKLALSLGIPFVMWGEHEREYEGKRACHTPGYKITYEGFLQGDDFCGKDPSIYLDQFAEHDYYWWSMPSQAEMDAAGLYQTYWSEFEPWDNEAHRKLAAEKCGLQGNSGASVGTFTSTSQVDDKMQPFFMFMAFVKFGFGRTTADVNLEVRNGRMTREEGVQLVRATDSTFPREHLEEYLDYFGMDRNQFAAVIEKHANPEIVVRTGEFQWVLREEAR